MSIRESFSGRRGREAVEASHALKGLCLMMGLSRLAELCRRLESMAAEGKGAAGWNDLLNELEAVLEPSLDEMRRQVGQA
jgi:HPt (histidine-containing phosphotransfer) domain-containing protein